MTDTHDPIACEAIRSASDRWPHGYTDVVPPPMTRAEERVLAEERERLLALFETDERAPAAATGGAAYGFVSREEFWVELVETFMSGRLGKAIIREASPRLYELLRTFVDRSELPPSGVARARD